MEAPGLGAMAGISGLGAVLGGIGEGLQNRKANAAKLASEEAAERLKEQGESHTRDLNTLPPEMSAALWKVATGKTIPIGADGKPMALPQPLAQTLLLAGLREQGTLGAAATRSHGAGKGFKPDVITNRILMNQPAYQAMANDYISAKNAYDQNPNSVSLQSLAAQEMQKAAPMLSSYLAQNPQATGQVSQVQQLNAGEQLKWIKAFEFAAQTTGSGRAPNPEMVNEAYLRIPGLSENPSLFAKKMHAMNTQIGEKIKGVSQAAAAAGDQDAAARYQQQHDQFYKGFTQVHDVPYNDQNNYPILPGYGLGTNQDLAQHIVKSGKASPTALQWAQKQLGTAGVSGTNANPAAIGPGGAASASQQEMPDNGAQGAQ